MKTFIYRALFRFFYWAVDKLIVAEMWAGRKADEAAK